MLVGEEGKDVHHHAATDCFEAMLAAMCLDGGLPEAQKMLAQLVFPEEVRVNARDQLVELHHSIIAAVCGTVLM